MIMNPVIQGGAEEKVYKITDRSNLYIGLQSAKAGEFVLSSVVIEYPQDKQPVSTVKTVDDTMCRCRSPIKTAFL